MEILTVIPTWLDRHVRRYNISEDSNLPPEVLRNAFTGCSNVEGFVYDHYFFFPKTDDTVDVTIEYCMHIPLKPENYGFPDGRMVGIKPRRRKLELSDMARDEYESLLKKRQVPANKLFESAGFIINDSMEYDFESLWWGARVFFFENNRGNEVKTERQLREFKAETEDCSYTPTGREVTKGICVTAGSYIRFLLRSLNMEDRIAFTHVTAQTNDIVSHDTTLVFDRGTGHWAVINSKSPLKPYNLVPFEKLEELGRPYAA